MLRESQNFLLQSQGEEGDQSNERQSPTLNSAPIWELMEGPAVQPGCSLRQLPQGLSPLTQGQPALHSLVLPYPRSQPAPPSGGREHAIPWPRRDLPLADAVTDLAGLDTATPAAPLCHDARVCWKTRRHLQGQLLGHLGSVQVLLPFPPSRTPHI